jgi:hypothetical protein
MEANAIWNENARQLLIIFTFKIEHEQKIADQAVTS